MRKLLLFVVITSCINSRSISQVSIQIQDGINRPRNLTKEDIEKLKTTTTIFAYGDTDKNHVEELQKALEQSWKITQYKIVSYRELYDYIEKPNYSFFTLEGSIAIEGGTKVTSVSYQLWLPVEGKKGKITHVTYADIELFDQFASMKDIPYNALRPKSSMDAAIEYIYTKGVYYNRTPGYLKCYLKLISDNLTKVESRGYYHNMVDKIKLARVKSATLYVPAYCLTRFNKFNGNEDKTNDPADLLSKYHYKYKIISNEELSKLIVNSTEPVYFVLYVRFGTDKFMNVFSSTDGLIFSHYQPLSYNLQDDDFKDIVDAMR
jgi:hypothetical protein